jgi:hypothetical protein
MKSTNVKSAREHLLDKYNLSMTSKNAIDINELKCDAKRTSPEKCFNPFVKSNVPYSRKRSMCFTQQMNLQKMKKQYIRSSSQYVNHNIKKCQLLECIENESSNSATLSTLRITRNQSVMPIIVPPEIDFDMDNKEKTLLSFANQTPNIVPLAGVVNRSGKKAFELSSLNSKTRTFQNTSTYETLEFTLPSYSKMSSIVVEDYSSKKSNGSKTQLSIYDNNSYKELVRIDFDSNFLFIINSNTTATNSITNKTSYEKKYTLRLCDPDTIDPQTFIISKRSYTLEINYDAL